MVDWLGDCNLEDTNMADVPPTVSSPNAPDPREPPRDPDCPLIWSFKTMEEADRWVAASKEGSDDEG